MKWFICLLIFFLATLKIFSQSRYWVGVSGGLWSSTANWSLASGGAPGASSPITANDVIFDNGFTGLVEMDVLSPSAFTINSLLITANSTVTLQRTQAGGGTRILQLASISAVTPGLKIDNGSTLTIDAVNSMGTLDFHLALTGAAGVTGEIAGNLFVKGTGTGNGNAFLDLFNTAGTFYANCVVKGTGVIKYFTDSGNTNSDPSGTYLTMQSGSIYEINKNGGSLPEGSWDDNSNIYITGATDNSGSIIFRQNNYGNFYWNTPSLANNVQMISPLVSSVPAISLNNVNFVHTNSKELFLKTGVSATNYDCTIRGNLDIQSGVIFTLTSNTVTSTAGSGILHVKGNITNAGTIKSDAVSGNTPTSQLELGGTTNQSITFTGTGNLTGAIMSVVMNGAGATLLSPVTLSGNQTSVIPALQLLNGKITTTSTNLLTMIDNAQYTGGSTNSFVSGPMKKIGDDNFIFPVGKGNIYAPIGIAGGSGATVTDEFTAEYIRSNPQGTYGTAYVSGIDHISYVEYWTLDRSAAAIASKNVSLDIHQTSFCLQLNNTFVSRYDGFNWTNELSTPSPFAACGAYQCGTITTNLPITTFSPFTLATDLPFNNNPLPVTLKNFHAVNRQGLADVKWELTACCSKEALFEIQMSADNRVYQTVATINGSEINTDYTVNGLSLPSGVIYYRLKITDYDGKISFSKVVAVVNTADNKLLVTSVWPSVVQSSALLKIISAKNINIEYFISDITGNILQRKKHRLLAGSNSIEILTNGLPGGIYTIIAVTEDNLTSTTRFVKK